MARRKKAYDELITTQLNIENEMSVVSRQVQGGKQMATSLENAHLSEELYELTDGEVLVIDRETGMEMYSCSLKSANISKTASKTQIRAGRDNTQWLELVSDSEITVEVVDIQAKRDWLALKLGGKLTKGSVTIRSFPKQYEVKGGLTSAKEVTLDHKISGNEAPMVYNVKTNEKVEASYSDGKLTLTGSVEVGDVVLVGSYKYEVADAESIEIPASDKGRAVELWLTRPVANSEEKVVFEKVYNFYKASLPTDFTDESTSEKSESAISTTFTVLKDSAKTGLGKLIYVPVNQ